MPLENRSDFLSSVTARDQDCDEPADASTGSCRRPESASFEGSENADMCETSRTAAAEREAYGPRAKVGETIR